MKMIKKYLLPILIIGSFISLASNILVFRSYIIQQISVADMNNVVPEMSLSVAKENDLTYPNINIFTVPFKTSLGRIYLRDSLYQNAIETFHAARKNNPYLLINENYLAETYLKINQRDSFDFYAKKIFSNAPNHPNHFAFYLRTIDDESNSTVIDSAFNLMTYKPAHVWKIYLSKLYHVDKKSESSIINLKIADSLFPKNDEIQYLINVINHGQKEIRKSNELMSVADALAEEDNFDGSIHVLYEALELNPRSNLIFDKIATSYFKLEQYDSSLFYTNKININKYKDIGRYHLIKGINLVKLNKKEEGCKEIYESILLGNKEAIKANRSFCN